MIGYIEGTLLKKEADKILLFANQIGYEIMLPAVVMETIKDNAVDDKLSFFIYYHQTERSPKPVLIGFNLEIEKDFFQRFISVEDIGPLKALRALTIPVRDIANAIESKDISKLKQLKGIGQRTAQKIIATLEGKMDKFAWEVSPMEAGPASPDSIVAPVMAVLVEQLGHRKIAARKMIQDALKRNSAIASPEELFDEVYKGEDFA